MNDYHWPEWTCDLCDRPISFDTHLCARCAGESLTPDGELKDGDAA